MKVLLIVMQRFEPERCLSDTLWCRYQFVSPTSTKHIFKRISGWKPPWAKSMSFDELPSESEIILAEDSIFSKPTPGRASPGEGGRLHGFPFHCITWKYKFHEQSFSHC